MSAFSFATSMPDPVPAGTVVRAGGTDLQQRLRTTGATPPLLDLTRIPGFADVTRADGVVTIGAGATVARVARDLVDSHPALAITAGGLATPQVRAVATIGGNLVQHTRCPYYRHRDLFDAAHAFLGHRRGGLAYATVLASGGFGAVCGSSVATTATMGRIALPEMVARNYAPSFASGSIASGGTLGMLIPPSVIMVLYGILTEQFVIALFAAAILPGLIAVAFYFVAILVTVTLKPGIAPPGPKMAWAVLVALSAAL